MKAGANAVEPMMTGLGCDLFVMIYLAKTKEVKFINGSGFAPMAATIDLYRSKVGIPSGGPLSASVPGAVGGAELTIRKHGSKTLAEALAELGHNPDIRNVKGVGSVKGIMVHPQTNVLMGGVSPAGDSYVIGW